MISLLDAVTSIALELPPDKVSTIANRLRGADALKTLASLAGSMGTAAAKEAIDRIALAYRSSPVPSDELASMLLAANHAARKIKAEQSLDLVWTGPTTPFVSPRRTEQVLLQLIDGAERSLFVTSFVAYNVSSIVRALNEATARGVEVSMLLESSEDHGGSLDVDAIGKMKGLVPKARLYAWTDKGSLFADGRVHAKVAVADGKKCFITSANLTGFAMERNMELGILITGGSLPEQLANHLNALVATRDISGV